MLHKCRGLRVHVRKHGAELENRGGGGGVRGGGGGVGAEVAE